MPSPERKQELEQRYLAELIKVGFDEAQAKKIVAEAADRLGADLDAPQSIPFYPNKQQRAVEVIARKEQVISQRVRKPNWNDIKRVRAHNIKPGMNFMDAMKELLTQDMKALEFSAEDIEFILGPA